MNEYCINNNPSSEEEHAEKLVSHHFHILADRYLGNGWSTQMMRDRISKSETGESYDEKVIIYSVDGVPRLKLEPQYEPNGPKLSFTIRATYL